MENVTRNFLKALMISTVVWTTACSKVGFDSVGVSEFETRTGPQHEQFDFNDPNARAKVDILIVDDNSASMYERQQKMAERLGPFIDTLGDVDWQIGITTTDTSDGTWGLKGSFVSLTGTQAKILSRNTPNYSDVFKASVVRNEIISCSDPNSSDYKNCPTSDERPLLAVLQAIDKRNSDNAGFFRGDASLALVVLSDEDESYALDGLPVQPQSVINTVRSTFGPNKTFTAYGIINRPEDRQCVVDNAPYSDGVEHPSVFIEQLIHLTNGVSGSVCDSDYVTALSKIGQSVNNNATSITLRALPKPDSLKITITPADDTLTYQVDGQQIKFNHYPRQGTRLTADYEVQAPEN